MNDKETLRRRAELLARPEVEQERSSEMTVALVFLLGLERYALGLKSLLEVMDECPVTPIPGAIREVVGAVNVRGEIRVVMDLALLLGFAEPSDRAGDILLLRRDGPPLGLLVDSVEGLVEIRVEELQALAPPHLLGLSEDGVRVLDQASLMDHPLLRGRTA